MSLVPTSTVFHELSATRYMSAIGLMVLLYDHILTFADEVKLIWTAPATYAKYIFLLNRYTVLGTLLAVAYETCGFVNTTFTDTGCKHFIFTCSMFAIISVGIANLLILQRVVILWEHRPIVLKIMTVGFLVSFIAQVATMIVTLMNLLPFISWSGVVGMCVATKSSPLLVAVWASPMLFEVFVLGSTALNALDRPRTIELPIIKALHSDGLGFFLSITLFRVLNLTFAALSRPSLTFLAVFFIWAMTTTVLGRLLIHLRRTECRPHITRSSSPASPSSPYDDDDDDMDEYSLRRRSRVISPFGLVPLNRKTSSGSAHSGGYWDGDADADAAAGHARALSADNPLEITQIPLAYPYHYRKRAHDPHVRPWD
ncbi:hypothetical protein K466DRAFT_585021 [Polyporus arcularius HHB13444]|uniref:DUF6533 domain-containing protein n=1 Tax=Polyporus arcularius HHB13444 TaxID=1314778 RepID=A0A5C3PIR4_9APHY|nr:hypothetical protein K466DRAFT_585021 [Polyporus arcularius HHB13444]